MVTTTHAHTKEEHDELFGTGNVIRTDVDPASTRMILELIEALNVYFSLTWSTPDGIVVRS